jgi:hypothetical protein
MHNPESHGRELQHLEESFQWNDSNEEEGSGSNNAENVWLVSEMWLGIAEIQCAKKKKRDAEAV